MKSWLQKAQLHGGRGLREGKGRLQDTAQGRLGSSAAAQATGSAAHLHPHIKPWGSCDGLKAAQRWVTLATILQSNFHFKTGDKLVYRTHWNTTAGQCFKPFRSSCFAQAGHWVWAQVGFQRVSLDFFVGFFFFFLVGGLHCCLISRPSSPFCFPSWFLSAPFTVGSWLLLGPPMLCVQPSVSGDPGSAGASGW